MRGAFKPETNRGRQAAGDRIHGTWKGTDRREDSASPRLSLSAVAVRS